MKSNESEHSSVALKLLKVSDMRLLEKKVSLGEISYGRMLEIINERSNDVAKDFILWSYENNWHRLYCKKTQCHAWVNMEKNPVYTFGSDEHYAKIIREHGIDTDALFKLYSQAVEKLNDNGESWTKYFINEEKTGEHGN